MLEREAGRLQPLPTLSFIRTITTLSIRSLTQQASCLCLSQHTNLRTLGLSNECKEYSSKINMKLVLGQSDVEDCEGMSVGDPDEDCEKTDRSANGP